jgi:hypothetical protein
MFSQHRRSTVKSFSFWLLICSVSLAAMVGEATASDRQKHKARAATTAQGSVSHSRHSHTKHQIFTRDADHCHRLHCVG